MAKMFYSMDEVQDKLGRSTEDIRGLVQDGILREFWDGPKLMFKVDEVDNLDISSLPPASEISDKEPPPPADIGKDTETAPSDTGSQFDLTPMDTDSGFGLVAGDSGDQINLEDTAESASKDDTVVTNYGENALDQSGSALGAEDPLAQGIPDFEDQIGLEADGSGSGLLDLSREADDTSLGAELLDEIYPEAGEQDVGQLPSQLEMPGGSETEIPAVAEETGVPVVPAGPEPVRVVQLYDTTSGAFGAMLIVPFVMLIYLACATTADIADVYPRFLQKLGGSGGYSSWYAVGGALIATLLVVCLGTAMANKSSQPARAKAKKTKKVKKKAEGRRQKA